ncbi:MAG: hypothetical protein FJ030_10660 [Chloroflexi bacterium]|nr:hypothetical protein [Chloroflexota bacterium]
MRAIEDLNLALVEKKRNGDGRRHAHVKHDVGLPIEIRAERQRENRALERERRRPRPRAAPPQPHADDHRSHAQNTPGAHQQPHRHQPFGVH